MHLRKSLTLLILLTFFSYTVAVAETSAIPIQAPSSSADTMMIKLLDEFMSGWNAADTQAMSSTCLIDEDSGNETNHFILSFLEKGTPVSYLVNDAFETDTGTIVNLTVTLSNSSGEAFRQPLRLKMVMVGDTWYILPEAVSMAGKADWMDSGLKAMGLDQLKTAAESGDASLNQPLLIAVLDSGCDVNHELFQGRISPLSRSFMPGWEDIDITDDGGHGTSVAGVLAAATPSSVQLLILKVLDESGYAPDTYFQEALRYAITQGADMITMSIALKDPDHPVTPDYRIWNDEIQKCFDENIPFFVSAGNEGVNTDYIYPAADHRVISISALQPDGSFAQFSNRGNGIQFCAPGIHIRVPVAGTANGYRYDDGTSVSSPMAAAAAAYLMMKQPGMKISELKEQLIDCSMDLGEDGWDELYGFGMPAVSRILRGDGQNASFPSTNSAAHVISATKGINALEESDNLFGGFFDKWCVSMEGGAYVEWEQDEPVLPKAIRISTGNDNSLFPGRNPSGMSLYAKASPEEDWSLVWHQEDGDIMEDRDFILYEFSIKDVQPTYQYFRLDIPETTGSNILQLAYVEITDSPFDL